MMLVLQFWSNEHRRTTLDVFVHEPFDFDHEYREASRFVACGTGGWLSRPQTIHGNAAVRWASGPYQPRLFVKSKSFWEPA